MGGSTAWVIETSAIDQHQNRPYFDHGRISVSDAAGPVETTTRHGDGNAQDQIVDSNVKSELLQNNNNVTASAVMTVASLMPISWHTSVWHLQSRAGFFKSESAVFSGTIVSPTVELPQVQYNTGKWASRIAGIPLSSCLWHAVTPAATAATFPGRAVMSDIVEVLPAAVSQLSTFLMLPLHQPPSATSEWLWGRPAMQHPPEKRAFRQYTV